MKVRPFLIQSASILGLLLLTGCNACTEQHDPRPDHDRFKQERLTGNAPIKKLNKDGSLPKVEEIKPATTSSASAGTSAGAQKYKQFCAPCHGADGAANSATAKAMNPKPRAFTDAKWQASVDDAHIAKVIKEGGAAVGLSPTMAPWGAMVSDAEIKDMVSLIRGFKK